LYRRCVPPWHCDLYVLKDRLYGTFGHYGCNDALFALHRCGGGGGWYFVQAYGYR